MVYVCVFLWGLLIRIQNIEASKFSMFVFQCACVSLLVGLCRRGDLNSSWHSVSIARGKAVVKVHYAVTAIIIAITLSSPTALLSTFPTFYFAYCS